MEMEISQAQSSAATDEDKNQRFVMNLGRIIYLENSFQLNRAAMVSINAGLPDHERLHILCRKEGFDLGTEWFVLVSESGFKALDLDKFDSTELITNDMARISIGRFAEALGLVKPESYDIRCELAMLVVDSNLKKNLSGHQFVAKVKKDAPALSELPFAILSVRFAASVGRAASIETDIMMVSGEVMQLQAVKKLFKHYYKGSKSPHTFRKHTSAAAAIDDLNQHADIARQIKLLVVDIDQLGNDLAILNHLQAILVRDAVIVVTVPVGMNEKFAIVESLFKTNVMMIVSAPIHDSFVPYLCALM